MQKIALLSLLVLLGCAGCSDQQSPAQQTAAPAAPVGAASQARQKPASPASIDVVANVVAGLGDRVSIRYDRVASNAAGQQERQVFMEVVGGTVAEAEATISRQLTAAGYVVGRRNEDANGARQLYRIREGRPIRTLSRPKGVGPALKDERAVGSIYLKQ